MYGIKEFVCDTEKDVDLLPIDCVSGSSAFVIESTNSYMLNGNQEWKLLGSKFSSGSGSGGSGGGGGTTPPSPDIDTSNFYTKEEGAALRKELLELIDDNDLEFQYFPDGSGPPDGGDDNTGGTTPPPVVTPPETIDTYSKKEIDDKLEEVQSLIKNNDLVFQYFPGSGDSNDDVTTPIPPVVVNPQNYYTAKQVDAKLQALEERLEIQPLTSNTAFLETSKPSNKQVISVTDTKLQVEIGKTYHYNELSNLSLVLPKVTDMEQVNCFTIIFKSGKIPTELAFSKEIVSDITEVESNTIYKMVFEYFANTWLLTTKSW